MAMPSPKTKECELMVIGTGMAGYAAALFAANQGLSVIQVGITRGFIRFKKNMSGITPGPP